MEKHWESPNSGRKVTEVGHIGAAELPTWADDGEENSKQENLDFVDLSPEKCQNSHEIIFSRQTDTGISFSRKFRAHCTKNQPKRMYWSRAVTAQIFPLFG